MSFQDAVDAMNGTIKTVFGTDAIYTYLSDSSTSNIRGVFDNAFIEKEGIATKHPIFRIVLADLSATPVEGDQVEIDDIDYMVRYHEPDSNGSTTLILEKI